MSVGECGICQSLLVQKAWVWTCPNDQDHVRERKRKANQALIGQMLHDIHESQAHESLKKFSQSV